MSKYYIDCEFDGHNGPLLSMAMICDGDDDIHIKVKNEAHDPWVVANVVPIMDQHRALIQMHVPENDLGQELRWFMRGDENPVIVADSPVDIARFCRAISTGPDGGWSSTEFPSMTFEVHNVDCYPTKLPGAVQHNAWWDAMALRYKLMCDAERG